MELTPEEFEEAVFEVTKDARAWGVIKDALSNEIYNIQANALEARTWDQLVEARGFAKGLAYVANLRENTIIAKKQREQDAV